ncbi:hypothetical protein, partial [Salmonella enterica]|uniref:hypothetical protein n=1 Tax=Salmonella enterica TaxID=28901 RepID=UPI003297802B
MTELSALQPAQLRLIQGDNAAATAITGASNGADALTVTLSRLDGRAARSLIVDAQDRQGRRQRR